LFALTLPRIRFTIRWPICIPIVIGILAASMLGAGATAHRAPAPSASTPVSHPGYVANDLAAAAIRSPQRTVEAVVTLQPHADAALVRAQIAADRGRIFRSIPLIRGLAVRMTASDAARLADLPGVRSASLNGPITSQGTVDASRLQSAYNQSIRADKAWAAGDTGKGVGVAVIDTGLAGGLPDFQGRAVASAVVNPLTADAKDDFGHGTHVAGLIAGNGFSRSASDPSYGHYAGVAPDANLIAIKADDGSGHTDVLSIIDGLQFAVKYASKYNIRVVNLSVRESAANSYRTDPLDAAVEATWMHGIVVVAAAGNLGSASDAVQHAPGNDPYVITVGGVDDHGTKSIDDDTVASWSSYGTTQDGFAKPDVLAPGAHLVAPLAPGSFYSTACSSCLVDNGNYIRLGGTSMAAAVASGAVADIVQAHPDWTPNQIKATLVKRSRGLSDASGAVSGREIALDKVLFSNNGQPEAPANQGLTPNDGIDPATGTIKSADESWAAGSWGAMSWGAGSWGAMSWGAAPGAWAADWTTDSYVPPTIDPSAFDPSNPQQCWQLLRTGFSAGSWGAMSWGSDDISAAHNACDTAASAQAGSWGAMSWGAGSWGAGSWGAGSWGAMSWGAGSWGAMSWGATSWATDVNK